MAIPIINVSIVNGSNGFRLDGVAAGNLSGDSVSNAGDVNGDVFADVIVGAYAADPNGERSGSSYVVFGKASRFSAATNLSSLDGNNGFRMDGVAAGDLSGKSVSGAGDVNGDGFSDVIIGANRADPNGTYNAGTSYVVFGKASGFSAATNLSSLDGNNGFRLDGLAAAGLSGISVSGAGDVNGDGFSDVIIGDYSGSGYVVFGKASALSAAINLSDLNGNNGFRLNNHSNIDSSVSDAGDVNGDGFDDVIVDEPGAYSGQSNYRGISYVVFGKASGFSATVDGPSLNGSDGFSLFSSGATYYVGKSVSSAGDINGDGFDDVIIGASNRSYVVFGKASGFDATLDLSSLNGSNGFRLDGGAASRFSGISVSSAGDFNGDGFSDMIIVSSGRSFVVFGKAAGFSAQLDMTGLDGSNGFRLTGVSYVDHYGSNSGFPVSSAGDVNGDGFDDLIVGSPGSDPNGDTSGSSYIIFGGNFTGEAVYLGTPGDDNLVGTSVAERFEAGTGNDRMSGLGGADVFHGGAGDDTIALQDLDFQSIDGGAGTDTIELTSANKNLNLANFIDTINNIETIDLTGSGPNILTLTLPDLLSLSDTTNTFTVNGDAGDRVNGLKDDWTDGGIDGNYHIYTNQGTIVRVDTAVNTDRPNAGVISLADLDGSNGFRLDGTGYDLSGRSVSNAGDVNGDGFDDVIIATRGNNYDANFSYIVFGQASGFDAAMNLSTLDGSNGFRLDGEAANEANASSSVSSAGDVNGDGFDDVMVGTFVIDRTNDYSGSCYVVFGKASGFDATLDLSSLNGSNGFSLAGAAATHFSGSVSSSGAGDVNGDGFDDVIIGAYGRSWSYVVFGKASGFSDAMDLSSLNGSNGFRLDGMAYDGSGFSVSDAGDVNGDGFDDVIVGAPFANRNSGYTGSSYVVFGKASGFDATLDLSSLNGSNGFRLDGVAVLDVSGKSVSSAGDVNGDGFDDVLIGAPDVDLNGGHTGSSYVVFGKGSGFDAAMHLSSLNGSNGFRLDGVADDYSGFSVSDAGDVNGDGFDDVIIGAHLADHADLNGYASGSSYVVFGKASGFDATLDLSSLNGSNGFRLDGVAAGDASGKSVSGAGDVNGDGFDDLLVGAPSADNFTGASYVIFGKSNFSGEVVYQGTPGDDNLTGTSAAERFEGGDGNDRMIGRGGADVFHGGAGNDRIRVSDLSFQLVDGGSGNNDVLSLGGGNLNLNLDLADVRGKINGIEIIYLHGGSGDKTLTLTAADVLNLSDTSNTLKVNGNEGDRVVLHDDWADGGIHGGFHTYTSDAAASPEAAVLLVGINLTADFA